MVDEPVSLTFGRLVSWGCRGGSSGIAASWRLQGPDLTGGKDDNGADAHGGFSFPGNGRRERNAYPPVGEEGFGAPPTSVDNVAKRIWGTLNTRTHIGLLGGIRKARCPGRPVMVATTLAPSPSPSESLSSRAAGE